MMRQWEDQVAVVEREDEALPIGAPIEESSGTAPTEESSVPAPSEEG